MPVTWSVCSKTIATLGAPVGSNDNSNPSPYDLLEYDRAWAACVELCDRVARGELPKMELRHRYPHEANSHRDMLGRVRTHRAIICYEWLTFEGYLRTAGPIPLPGWTRDRINPYDPEYSPAKTHWTSKPRQTGNRRNSVRITGDDRRVWSPEELGKKHGVSPDTIRRRITRGKWTDAELIANRPMPKSTRSLVQVTAQTTKLPPQTVRKGPNHEKRRDLANLWDNLMRGHHGPLQPSLPPADLSDLLYVARYLGDNANTVLAVIVAEWRNFAAYAAEMECSRQVPPEPSPSFLRRHARHAVSYHTKQHVLPEIKRREREARAALDETPNLPPPSIKPMQEQATAPQAYLEDHPMSFEQYDRELWRDYRIRGTREQYEEGVVLWFNKQARPAREHLSLLPVFIQRIVIAKKCLDFSVIEPLPANPNRPPELILPFTREGWFAEPVDHSDPFPDDQLANSLMKQEPSTEDETKPMPAQGVGR
jgi:hypothetical protein